MGDFAQCDECGTRTHIDLLDAKLTLDADNEYVDVGGDPLLCRKCYGVGWAPAIAKATKEDAMT